MTPITSVPYANHASQSDRWKNNDPIVQTGEGGSGSVLPIVGEGSRLIWYPRKYAFLAGFNDGGLWQDSNIGEGSVSFGLSSVSKGNYSFAAGFYSKAASDGSVAFGKSVQAKGNFSVAMGNETVAIGESSFAMGEKTKSDGLRSVAVGFNSNAIGSNSLAVGSNVKSEGNNSIAMGIDSYSPGYVSIASGYGPRADGFTATALGFRSRAIGDASFAIGDHTLAKTFASVAVGAYNNVQDNPNGPTAELAGPSDRIFQIGNGSSETDLSNALTILRDGKIGLGNNALAPQFILDIGARARLQKDGNATAGIYFDDSQHEPSGFVGMTADDELGFYIGDAWRFRVAANGQGRLNGALIQTSDRRLKRDFTNLTNSLTKISNVNGYNYYMKDPKIDQSLQTGVIAQEIEAIFPELVHTDKDGVKSVNYSGFIPHLIESVKTLKMENEELRKSVKRLEKLEASINQLIENNKAVLGKTGKTAR